MHVGFEVVFAGIFIGGILLDRLILKTILQKNTILKLMRYLASSLVETSSIKKVLRGILMW
jgi:hypothetical protein